MATSLQAKGPTGIPVDLTATPDGRLVVNVVNDVAADRELLPTRYTCKQTFNGASIGDVIRQTVALDVTGAAMAVISVLWENESTNTAISAPPNVTAYLTPLMQGDAITLAQLLSAGMATAQNQVAQIGYLADIAQAQGRYASYATQEVDESIEGTTYVRKAGADAGDTWLIQRIVESGTSTVISYAGVRNNSAIASPADAWAARTTLTYGEVTAA